MTGDSPARITGMDTGIVYALVPDVRDDGTAVCGRAFLPARRVYVAAEAALAARRTIHAPTRVEPVRFGFAADARFEVLQGSIADHGGLQTVAFMSSFPEALRVADGRGYMGVGQCRIHLARGWAVYDTAEAFAAAGAGRGVPLLTAHGLNAEFFVTDASGSIPAVPVELRAVAA